MGRINRYRTALSRHHRSNGFGIHSPFAFNFVLRVLRERLPYYAYDEIKQLRSAVINVLGKKRHRRVISLKNAKMIFRVTNCFNPKHILQIGTSFGVSSTTMMKVSSTSRLYLYEPKLTEMPLAAQVLMPYLDRIELYNSLDVAIDDYCDSLSDSDMVYITINEADNDEILPLRRLIASAVEHRETVVVIRNLAANKHLRTLLNDIKVDMPHGQTFSNGKIAIVVALRRLKREDFMLWF